MNNSIIKLNACFFIALAFLLACSSQNNVPVAEKTSSSNVFDTASGYWLTYAGTLHCNNCNGIKTTLQIFVTPFTAKMKYKMQQQEVESGSKIILTNGNYSTFGRYYKRAYQSVFEFKLSGNKRMYFVRMDDDTFSQLTLEKNEFANGKKYVLKRVN